MGTLINVAKERELFNFTEYYIRSAKNKINIKFDNYHNAFEHLESLLTDRRVIHDDLTIDGRNSHGLVTIVYVHKKKIKPFHFLLDLSFDFNSLNYSHTNDFGSLGGADIVFSYGKFLFWANICPKNRLTLIVGTRKDELTTWDEEHNDVPIPEAEYQTHCYDVLVLNYSAEYFKALETQCKKILKDIK